MIVVSPRSDGFQALTLFVFLFSGIFGYSEMKKKKSFLYGHLEVLMGGAGGGGHGRSQNTRYIGNQHIPGV